MGLIHSVIRKWGNSLGLRLPKSVLEEAGLAEGTPVGIKVKDGAVVIAAVKQPRYLLKSLLDGVGADNLHQDEGFGEPHGRELL